MPRPGGPGSISSIEDTLSQIGRRAAGGRVAVLSRGEGSARVIKTAEPVTTTRSSAPSTGTSPAPPPDLSALPREAAERIARSESTPPVVSRGRSNESHQASGVLHEIHALELGDLLDRKALVDEQILAMEERHIERMEPLWSRRQRVKKEYQAAVLRIRQALGLPDNYLFDPLLMDFVPTGEKKG